MARAARPRYKAFSWVTAAGISMQPIDRVRQMLLELVGGPDTPFAERRAASKEFEGLVHAPAGPFHRTG